MPADSDSPKEESVFDFDPLDNTNDPNSLFRNLRFQKEPHKYRDQWFLSRHAHVAAVLSDSRFVYPESEVRRGGLDWIDLVTGPYGGDLVPRIREKCAELSRIWIFRRNYSDHTRLRNLLRASFTRDKLQVAARRAEIIADDLLDKCNGQSRIEVISALAYPLPLSIISEIVGVPVALAQMRGWARDLSMSLSAHTDSTMTERGLFAIAGLVEFLRKAMADPANAEGMLGSLLAATVRGELSRDELLSNCAAIMVAGHVTTQHLIGTSLLLLLQHPEQMQLLRENAALASGAVDEVMRYEPPVQAVRRIATEDVVLGGVTIRKGDRVISLVLSANRDPDVVSDPDRFDITREPTQYFTFGGGSHFCLGANLARLETAIALNSMLRQFPRLRLESETPDWEKRSLFRNLKTLHVVAD